MLQPLTQYYELWFDGSDPFALSVSHEDLRGFNPSLLYQCTWFKSWDEDITFYVYGEHIGNYIPSVEWGLVSERVRMALDACHIEGIQYLPVRVIHRDKRIEMGRYWALNVLRAVEALDWERTRWSYPERRYEPDAALGIIKAALRREALIGTDVFRLSIKGDIRVASVYLSPRFKQCLEDAKATDGFKFIPVPVY